MVSDSGRLKGYGSEDRSFESGAQSAPNFFLVICTNSSGSVTNVLVSGSHMVLISEVGVGSVEICVDDDGSGRRMPRSLLKIRPYSFLGQLNSSLDSFRCCALGPSCWL